MNNKRDKVKTLKTLEKLQRGATAMFENIEWNLGALVGATLLVQQPSIVNELVLPEKFLVEELGFTPSQVLGLSLAPHERKAREREILALVRRCLICESTELATDILYRAARIAQAQPDPYHGSDGFSVKFIDLTRTKPGNAGALISAEQVKFLNTCMVKLRNLIRHNKSRLLPKQSIVYTGKPAKLEISIKQEWGQGSNNELAISLGLSYRLFKSVAATTQDGISVALSAAKH